MNVESMACLTRIQRSIAILPVLVITANKIARHSTPRKEPSRRKREHKRYHSSDLEASPYHDDSPASRRRLPQQQQPHIGSPPIMGPLEPRSVTPAGSLNRRRSLVRPERRIVSRDDPDYHYRKHAQRMNVMASETGADPIMENNGEDEDESDGEKGGLQDGAQFNDEESPEHHHGKRRRRRRRTVSSPNNNLLPENESTRPQHQRTKVTKKDEKSKQRPSSSFKRINLWIIYCYLVTFWCPGIVLTCFGKSAKAQQRAWREKMGLISIILMIAAFVGFITFGFTQAVCGPAEASFNAYQVGIGYMIFHGIAYNLDSFRHPAVPGIRNHTNPLYDPPWRIGGQDGSFLFQNVNGACKGLIRTTPNSTIPVDSSGDLAWYFPCHTFNADGSSKPNKSMPYFPGYGCHLKTGDQNTFSSPNISNSATNVVYSWDQIKNNSRDLVVFSGSVLDLGLLDWFDNSVVFIPTFFNDARNNLAIKGLDMTHAWTTSGNKQMGECLSEIVKVGSIDSNSIGCIASQVVLYVALIFILSIVGIKFALALMFQWFLSRKYAAKGSSITTKFRAKAREVEDWSNDIYKGPSKLIDAKAGYKRSSMLPSSSRFTNPYEKDRFGIKKRPPPTTMSSQTTSARLAQPSGAFPDGMSEMFSNKMSTSGTRSSAIASTSASANQQFTVMSDVTLPLGFIHDLVVPQPPASFQPFGYPLVHTICLVTAYSEGKEGIRTTLNSVATTEYPNSHKVMLVVCDGFVKGHGETMTTPDIVLGMMYNQLQLPEQVMAHSYVAVASGSKRHNMAKIYAGFYDYGEKPAVPKDKRQKVPMVVVVKCGTPEEANQAKPGNRGKRDSQVILMSFLQKVMFDERMTELEYEIFNGLWKVTGISPDFYETILMVDADTKIYPDSLTHMNSAMVRDPEIMGLCGETKIANKRSSWVTTIQVFEYFVSHHLAKSFESVFGGVTCLPGCFSMYRIKAPKGGENYWVPILANPDIVEHYSENVVDTLHKKNLLLLGEDRYLSTLMLKTFPKRKQIFVPQAVCKTTVPETFKVLLSQRRRWINSTVHNLMELVLVRDLCGTFCFSMQFVVFVELIGTLVLPAAITFTFYLIIVSIATKPVPVIPLILLALILGLPGALVILTAHSLSYVAWMLIYLCSLPIWNFILPMYAFWKFDDFSWGETRKTAGERTKMAGLEYEGEFDSTKITMKRWSDFEKGKLSFLDACNLKLM